MLQILSLCERESSQPLLLLPYLGGKRDLPLKLVGIVGDASWTMWLGSQTPIAKKRQLISSRLQQRK